jgi:hypothetical protein
MIYAPAKTKKEILASSSKPVTSSKFIARNTVLIKYEDGTQAIRYHLTDVYTDLGKFVTLTSGGYRTVTTKERINDNPLNPRGENYRRFIGLSQDKGIWYVYTFAGKFDYYDGITFNKRTGKPTLQKHTNLKAVAQMKKKIAKFVSLITKDNLPVPSGGDCWLCSFHSEDGKSWGDNRGDDNDHLLQHIKEGYLHGSLLVNAMHEAGFSDLNISTHYYLQITDTFKRALRRYLQKRLIQNIAVK